METLEEEKLPSTVCIQADHRKVFREIKSNIAFYVSFKVISNFTARIKTQRYHK